MFFDQVKVKNKVDKQTRKVLSRFGSFVRQTSRRSIRRRKKSSRPGQPPSSHTGVLKRFIFFGYDQNRRNVVIGPVVVPGKAGKAPEALEHGGRVTVTGGDARRRTTVIEARPFMGPAFRAEVMKVPSLWVNAIK
jgi:hypothetical protein